MYRNCVTAIPIIRSVGISDRISFVSVVSAVSVFGVGFLSLFSLLRWFRCLLLFFRSSFFFIGPRGSRWAPTPNGDLKRETRNRRQEHVEDSKVYLALIIQTELGRSDYFSNPLGKLTIAI